MRNGTSDGISQIPIPIDNITFNGIDPLYITAGSLAVDNKRNSIWVSVFSYGNKGEIFRYNLESQSFDRRFDLPSELNSPVGMIVDNDDGDNSGQLWITNGGSSIFYKLNPNNGKITKFVTSKASHKIFGQALFENINEKTTTQDSNSTSNDNIIKNAYTLPYWIQKSTDGSLWFNEQEGNKIGRFDPHDMTLVEYWVPSQNRMWGSCSSGDIDSNTSNNTNNQRCGIANVLQFSINTETTSDDDDNDNSHSRRHENHQNIWFTEWSENKIAKVNADHKLLPFSVTLSSLPHNKEITIKRGESKEIKVKVIPKDFSSFSTISGNMYIRMIASSTFTSTGDFGNSTASFSKEWLSIDTESDNNSNHDVSFTFTPSMDLKPGQYTLMIGAEDDAISYQRAIKLQII
jgi:virginiamycin B lyase